MRTEPDSKRHKNDQQDAIVMRRVRRQLRSIASRLRMLLVLRAAFMCVGVVLISVLLVGVADYLLRLPQFMRLVLLLAIAFALVRLCIKRLFPAWRSLLSEPDVALLIEKHDPQTRGILASAVDLDREQ